MKLNKICMAAMLIVAASEMSAQTTPVEMEWLTVNENVTTIVTASEPVKLVDLSTDKIAGDQPIENTVRLKPKEASKDGDILAIVTIVTERYRTQYGLVYTSKMSEAVTDKEILPVERTAYAHPSVTMSQEEMYRHARRIWNSPARFRDVSCKGHGMRMRLNNIYTCGDYFFIDFSVSNRTNIRFDIDEIRLKLTDKKITKATNSQSIELKPEMMLEKATSFSKGYRNVIAVKKLTFPDEKVLTIEMSEDQISGRTMKLEIDYEDVLSADSFDDRLLEIE
ncbi:MULTISPECIES: conjugative transposon protein TraN [Bacteroidaceae]|uniref:conjugative transposon protein TraN n=1 Tax=Bacteroidaceae TaxID=815 RepID=UPI00033F19CA|nr:conjugative transposon protein TraN [Phocaeicola vulgatus]CCZ70292.1 conjugative transposon TraN protein [Bacteroides sp. CAG:702]